MGLFGCLTRVIALAALLALVGLAWLRAPDLWERLGGRAEAPPTPPPGLLADVAERFRSTLVTRDSVFVLTGQEATALLHAESAQFLPEGVTPGAVEFTDGEARVSVLLDVSTLAGARWPASLRRLLPGAVPITVHGVPLVAGRGEGLLLVRRVSLAGMPMPRTLVEYLAVQRPRGVPGELPPDAIRLPLPPAVSGVYIDDGVLTLSLDL